MRADIHVPTGLTTDGLLGRRYLARIIDSIVILISLAIVVGALSIVMPNIRVSPAGNLALLPVLLLGWIGYGALFESSKWQATLGKRVTGLRVYSIEGGRLPVMQAARRNLIKDGPSSSLAWFLAASY